MKLFHNSSSLPILTKQWKRKRKLVLLKLNRSNEGSRKGFKNGESGNVLRHVLSSFRFLAIHGQGPCLDRSSSRRKAREVGEGSGDQKGQRRIAAAAS
ncbi:unnamed protein product [Lathyrus sativus]|nr:unnamed protein product [Lathyrus sativus]